MSFRKVQELSNKFSNKLLSKAENPYQSQRDRLKVFSELLYSRLRAIISELGNDLVVLKLRNFDRSKLKELASIYHDMITMSKDVSSVAPYESGWKFVKYVEQHYPVLKNLDVITQQHVKNTNEDFGTTSTLRHPTLDGLNLLIHESNRVRNEMATHPIISYPTMGKTPPQLQEKEEPVSTLGPEDLTKI